VDGGASVRRSLRITLASAALFFALWLLDAAFMTFALGSGSLAVQIFSPTAEEVWSRLPLLPLAIAVVLLVQGVYDLRAAREETTEERRHMIMLYDNMTDGIVFLDHDLRIIYINPAAQRLGGTRLVDAVGWPCHKVLIGSDEPCDGCCAQEVFRTGETRSAVKHEVTSAGQENWLEQKWFPMLGQNGRVDAVLEVARDITEVKLLEREVADCQRLDDMARRRAEVASELKPDQPAG
jgi:PAS domain S-box-containing protein